MTPVDGPTRPVPDPHGAPAPRRGDRFAALPVDPDTPGEGSRPSHLHPGMLLAVAVGAALGAPARYGLGLLFPTTTDRFPTGTFLVNVSGAFALSVLMVVVVERLSEGGPLTRYVRPLAGVGFLGAYTTYSTYAVEVDVAVRDGHALIAAGYAVAALLAGLLATAAGLRVGRRVEGALPRPPGPPDRVAHRRSGA